MVKTSRSLEDHLRTNHGNVRWIKTFNGQQNVAAHLGLSLSDNFRRKRKTFTHSSNYKINNPSQPCSARSFFQSRVEWKEYRLSVSSLSNGQKLQFCGVKLFTGSTLWVEWIEIICVINQQATTVKRNNLKGRVRSLSALDNAFMFLLEICPF